MTTTRKKFLGGLVSSFFGAYADKANRFLAVEYHNGWELGV